MRVIALQPAKSTYLHRFTPARDVNAPTQCQVCWGWYDDWRHYTRST
jgi:hypothetical protein